MHDTMGYAIKFLFCTFQNKCSVSILNSKLKNIFKTLIKHKITFLINDLSSNLNWKNKQNISYINFPKDPKFYLT